MKIDPISITVLQNRLEGIAEEMSYVLRRTAYSPNIKERADFSCAIFDNQARLIAQAEAIPVHLGSMGFVAKPILEKYRDIWESGDAVIVNSPRGDFGGTHLPDITLVAPVFEDKQLKFIIANRAHHADVGGAVAGSLPGKSTEIFQEGIIIPPVLLYKAGKENVDVMDLVLENVRTPRERRGDLRAQYASLQKGISRLVELMKDRSLFSQASFLPKYIDALLNWSEKATRERLDHLPRKRVSYSDVLDSDGIHDQPVKIQCSVEIKEGGEIIFDFEGSDPEQTGNCNAPKSITTSAVYYVIRLLTGRAVPTNEGCFRSVIIKTPGNSVVNPSRNAATSSANTETSQRIVDVVMGCISQLVPFPASSAGTMNNLIIGGKSEDGSVWTIYETIGGGAGAIEGRVGTSAIQLHMTNTENTPIEALELIYPLELVEYSIRDGSGGAGQYHGGNGITRKIRIKVPSKVSIQSERRKFPPPGQSGGSSGSIGINRIIKSTGEILELPGKVSVDLDAGDIIEINTPGGGGFGKP